MTALTGMAPEWLNVLSPEIGEHIPRAFVERFLDINEIQESLKKKEGIQERF